MGPAASRSEAAVGLSGAHGSGSEPAPQQAAWPAWPDSGGAAGGPAVQAQNVCFVKIDQSLLQGQYLPEVYLRV